MAAVGPATEDTAPAAVSAESKDTNKGCIKAGENASERKELLAIGVLVSEKSDSRDDGRPAGQ